uniref:PCI domain-containing protein n=1 Tax=Alexandrium catenella TaxID=2925 RepID=A0A7S1LNF2_ALECA
MKTAGRVDEAVEEMLALEKKCRMASDGINTSKLICRVVKLYHEGGEWNKLREHIVMLAKKRGQLRRGITDMVHLAQGWLEGLDKEKKLELIGTLNEVTEGKIFLECERARLTAMLAAMKEAEGDTEEAANLLQEVQVEAFGAMEAREKTEYILNQMRLVLLKKDFVRTQIVSKKINPKLLEKDEFQDLKVTYYEYMVKYWLHEKKMLDACKCYLAIFNTPCVQADEEKWKKALTAHVLYLTLAAYDNEQDDMLNKLDQFEAKKLDKVPAYKQLIKIFLRKEIAAWPLAEEAEFKSHPVFQDTPHEGASARWDMLRKRIVQHNIKVVSEYYDEIHTARLCELIGLDDKATEAELSELVCAKFVSAKIDRPAGRIRFGERQTYTDRLNDWSDGITNMLDLVENTCHLIQKEQMVHAARSKLKPKK